MTGKLSATGEVLIRLERAAMIHFGVPSFGVHLNGYVKATGEAGTRSLVQCAISEATLPIASRFSPLLCVGLGCCGENRSFFWPGLDFPVFFRYCSGVVHLLVYSHW